MTGAARTRLGANECPLPPPRRVLDAIARAANDASRYPTPETEAELCARLARTHAVGAGAIALGNGASELIDLVFAAFVPPGDDAVLCEPTFPLFRLRGELAGARIVSVPAREHRHDLEAMAAAITPRTRLVVVVQPNNPTGTIVRRDAWRAFLGAVERAGAGAGAGASIGAGASVPGADTPVVLCDEAYVDYVEDPDAPDVLDDVRAGRRVVSLRTFSKAHSLAGLRVGYAIAAPEAAARLRTLRPRFSVNSLALAAATASLEGSDQVAAARALADEGKRALAPALERLGAVVVPSQANFLLVRWPDLPGDVDVCSALASRGVDVFDLTRLGFGMERGWARVTIGHPDEHARLLDALGSIVAGRALEPPPTRRAVD